MEERIQELEQQALVLMQVSAILIRKVEKLERLLEPKQQQAG